MRNNALIIFILFYGFFIMQSNIVILAPILKFIQSDLSIPQFLLGYILAAFPIVATFSNIALGPFLDKYGRKRMMLIGAVLCAIFFALTALATNATAIIIFRIMTALSMPMLGASILPYITDFFPKEKRFQIMGYVMSATYVATIISIPLGIVGSGYFTWRYVFYAMTLVTILFIIITQLYLPNSNAELSKDKIGLHTYKRKFLLFFKNTNITNNLIAKYFQMMGHFVFAGFYPVWLFETFSQIGVSYTDIAILFFVCGVIGWIGSNLSGKISVKIANKTVLYGVLVILSGVFTFLTPLMSPEYYYLQYFAYVPVTLSQALFSPIILTMLMQSVEPVDRGSLNGLNNAVFQLGTALGVMLGAYLYLIDRSLMLNGIVSAILLFISAIVFMVFVNDETQLNA